MKVKEYGFEGKAVPNRTGRGAPMRKQQLSRTFGVALHTINNAIEHGAQVLKRGSRNKPWVLPAGDFLRWLIEHETKTIADPDLSDLRRNQIKLIISQTEKLEMKNAE